jgi:hypothetical protein
MNEARDYLELKGFDQTYWGSVIIAAEKRRGFTEDEDECALSWVTCACGSVTSDIPRNEESKPYDEELFDSGGLFSELVSGDAFLEAAQTLVRIEARAIIVAKAHLKEQRA